MKRRLGYQHQGGIKQAEKLQHETMRAVPGGRSRTVAQCRFGGDVHGPAGSQPTRPNTTGMPDRLKTGLERLSGFDLSPVRVHYNSPKPAQMGALAYAQGTEIHLGRGQERHLPHEGWHVVQQMQGRVRPTAQYKSIALNTDSALEREADVMGSRATQVSAYNAKAAEGERPVSGCGLSSAGENVSQLNIIQRNVGFEFEVDPVVETFSGGRLWGYNSLPKGARILNGVDFYVEADGLPNGHASWEFVTTDFPETPVGFARLVVALDNIDGIVSALRGSQISNGNPAIYNPVGNTFAAFANPVANRYFTISNQNLRVKPQVTAGFALDALDELFHSATTAAGVGVSDMMRTANSMQPHGLVIAPQLDVPLSNMRNEAGNAIVANMGGAADPALRGLVTQIMQIIIAGRQNIGATPKTIMRLALGRTDMAAAFNTLPVPVLNQLQPAPATFENIVMDAVDAYIGGGALNRNAPVISGNLFSDNMYANDPRHNMQSPFLQVTRTQWLTSIVAGNDLLSQGHYPVRTGFLGWENRTDRRANALLDSMGALHNRLDPGNRPIFEIRSSRQIFASMITPYALDFFKYVRFLHNPGALTESTHLSGAAVNDVADMVGYAPNRANVINAMIVNAMANYDN